MATNIPQSAIMNFVQRFRELEVRRDTGNELIKDLLLYSESVETSLRQENTQLAKSLENAQLDLEDARQSRREMQLKLNAATARAGQFGQELDTMRNRNPYIIVLIDGDGMIFNENLISQGLEGGKQAANLLRNSVLHQCNEVTHDFEIMAKVCANVSGLSKALRRDGTLANADDFKEFTLGFTQGKASFDFIDVGHGKERADSKIKENMRWHLRNYNCKHIVLGISHDAGYAPFIDEIVSPNEKSRITIMEGYPTVRELAATGIQIMNFNNIFRSDKLIDRAQIEAPSSSTWAGVTSNCAVPPTSTSPIIRNGNASSPLTIIPKKPTPAPPKPAWVPQPRGLDPTINVSLPVLDRIKRRSHKLCNNHYLRGPCILGPDCRFEHEHSATDEELKAIAFLTRLNPCTNGQDCELEYCIYGHHCPSVVIVKGEANPICDAFGCRFGKEDHPPGTVIKRPRKEKSESYY